MSYEDRAARLQAREDLIDSMARTVWCNAWASAMEEAGRSISGAKIEEVAPPTPAEAHRVAEAFMAALEEANDVALERVWEELDGEAKDLGHYLIMEALGTGVAWTDDHDDEHGLEVPDLEVILDDPDDEETLSFSM